MKRPEWLTEDLKCKYCYMTQPIIEITSNANIYACIKIEERHPIHCTRHAEHQNEISNFQLN